LIAADDLCRAIVANSDAAFVAKDLNGTVLLWNPAAERLLGYSEEEMKGRSIHALLPLDRQAEDDAVIARIRAGEQVTPYMTTRLHKSGKPIPVGLSASPLRDGNGEIFGISYVARDATAFVEKQRALDVVQSRFEALANHMPQLAWVAAADGTMEWCNNRWIQYTGVSIRDMDSGGWRSVMHPDHFERVLQSFAETVGKGEDWEETFPIRRKDGEYRWFLSRANPVKNEVGKIIRWIGTNTDITEARDREDQIRLLLMEVNHRSKNMLATVIALARRSAPGHPEFVDQFEERLRSLAVNQDILVRRQWREVPLEELVWAQLSFVQEARGEVAVAGPDCSLTPHAAEVIGMALHELATNSLKYGALSAEGGLVDVGWECTADGKTFRIWWQESGGPPVSPPTRKGFGTTLICEVPRRSFGADVTLDFKPGGVCWALRLEGRSPPIYIMNKPATPAVSAKR